MCVCVCVILTHTHTHTHTHAGILFSLLKKEGNTSFCDIVNEPEGNYAKWYKPVCVCVCAHACAQSCPTLCDPMDCSLPGSSVRWILQARTLEGCHALPPRDLLDPRIEQHFLGLLHCRQILYCWVTRVLEQTKPHIHTLVAKMRGEIF